MKIALTGTPGTGKTTISAALREQHGFKTVAINDVVRACQYVDAYDGRRDCLVVNLAALRKHQFQHNSVIEGHLSHHLDVDRVIVLRTDPRILEERLSSRGFSREKVQENVEAEMLDVILTEAVDLHDGRVYELDSTGPLDTTIQHTKEIIEGHNLEQFAPGRIDWTEQFYDA